MCSMAKRCRILWSPQLEKIAGDPLGRRPRYLRKSSKNTFALLCTQSPCHKDRGESGPKSVSSLSAKQSLSTWSNPQIRMNTTGVIRKNEPLRKLCFSSYFGARSSLCSFALNICRKSQVEQPQAYYIAFISNSSKKDALCQSARSRALSVISCDKLNFDANFE